MKSNLTHTQNKWFSEWNRHPTCKIKSKEIFFYLWIHRRLWYMCMTTIIITFTQYNNNVKVTVVCACLLCEFSSSFIIRWLFIIPSLFPILNTTKIATKKIFCSLKCCIDSRILGISLFYQCKFQLYKEKKKNSINKLKFCFVER